VTSIGDYAFRSCSALTDVSIPESVTSIGDYTFCSCSALNDVTIGEGVTSIGHKAFYGCSSSMVLSQCPGDDLAVGRDAFYGVASYPCCAIDNYFDSARGSCSSCPAGGVGPAGSQSVDECFYPTSSFVTGICTLVAGLVVAVVCILCGRWPWAAETISLSRWPRFANGAPRCCLPRKMSGPRRSCRRWAR
jgi:hypothetical protein